MRHGTGILITTLALLSSILAPASGMEERAPREAGERARVKTVALPLKRFGDIAVHHHLSLPARSFNTHRHEGPCLRCNSEGDGWGASFRPERKKDLCGHWIQN